MEPPYWYYPVRQSLAVAGSRADAGGPTRQAEEQFQRALKRAPSNGWSRYGLAELYKARGKADQASKLEADLAKSGSATDSSWSCRSCDPHSTGLPADLNGRGHCALRQAQCLKWIIRVV
ncbi:tetratricopeptide repeat protein [Bradyrhizobium sp. CB1650]|uniref:tetratricopeptide repeat protein n=1 Tax=Bradyrhizobium sp. CB1650 TaxID=3039153 RepID=UPI002434F8D3|nr:tetratricopeptide repeat protein [Bradyrhizobium sp. CB1650]WGD55280.1 tetratricopeptide repeat protein [Bradyrhizobium sp. CB1650]